MSDLLHRLARLADHLGLTAEQLVDQVERDLTLLGPPGDPMPASVRAIEGPRYVQPVPLGAGGMGVVHRVYDRHLRRTVALKAVRVELADSPSALRLQYEAEVTGRLQHPGIVPVHDAGTLDDGRPFYVMREVVGQTLDTPIRAVHRASRGRRWSTADGWSLRRLIDTFRRVCDTLAYAHSKGVVHRDVKPSNIMIEDYGAVLVLDWGVAKAVGMPELWEGTLAGSGGLGTVTGHAVGTIGYMAPEQVYGELDLLGPHSDVFALGIVLHQILGTPPNTARDAELPEPPADLAEIARRATRVVPSERYRDAAELSTAVGAWLDGLKRREEAEELVKRADALLPDIARLRDAAEQAEEAARRALVDVKPHDPVARKEAGWTLEDEAASLRDQTLTAIEQRARTLHAALERDGDLVAAHRRLADHYRAVHVDAVQRADAVSAARAELLVAAHDDGRHARWLRREGRLSLQTDPPGATATWLPFVSRARRLVPGAGQPLGTTPLEGVPVPSGSGIVRLEAPGRRPVDLPVLVPRGEEWSCVAPGARSATAVPLPHADVLGRDDRYVPAGWFLAGGDGAAVDPYPRSRWWADGLVVRKHPVTRAEWCRWLDSGDPAAVVPGPSSVDWEGPASRTGDASRLPVHAVAWFEAMAFVQWLNATDGTRWRLPHELEWEKTARGVDGRCLPWGDHLEPTWARNFDSVAAVADSESVDARPLDISVYGVCGLTGNVRDYCRNAWERHPPRRGGAIPDTTATVDDAYVSSRGGAAWSNRGLCHPATRFGAQPTMRFLSNGLRLFRDLHDTDWR